MDASYDAQHNEFCAYVLAEAETPFGLTLGNFKTYAHVDARRAACAGLWDADTDQIIFGAHQIAYRVGDAIRRSSRTRSRASSPSCRTRRSPSSTLDDGVRVTEAFYVPHGPKHDRVVALRRRRHAPQRRRRARRRSRSFRGRCWSASASTASPRRRCARSCEGDFIRSYRRGVGLRALVGRLARAGGRRRRAARAGVAGRDARGDARAGCGTSTR